MNSIGETTTSSDVLSRSKHHALRVDVKWRLLDPNVKAEERLPMQCFYSHAYMGLKIRTYDRGHNQDLAHSSMPLYLRTGQQYLRRSSHVSRGLIKSKWYTEKYCQRSVSACRPSSDKRYKVDSSTEILPLPSRCMCRSTSSILVRGKKIVLHRPHNSGDLASLTAILLFSGRLPATVSPMPRNCSRLWTLLREMRAHATDLF